LLIQVAAGDFLRLLGQLLYGPGDTLGEAIDEQSAHEEERHGDAAPQLRQPTHLLLDAGQGQPQPHIADHLLLGRAGLAPGTDEQLVRRLRLLRDDGGRELDEPLPRALDICRTRARSVMASTGGAAIAACRPPLARTRPSPACTTT